MGPVVPVKFKPWTKKPLEDTKNASTKCARFFGKLSYQDLAVLSAEYEILRVDDSWDIYYFTSKVDGGNFA